MAHKVHPNCRGQSTNVAENSGLVLPSFTFAPFAGRSPLDEVQTDLVLMTRLYRHDVHAALHVNEPNVANLLKVTMKEEFLGKRGEFRLLQTELPNSQGQPGRQILLIGLGQARSYDSKTSCQVFEILFRQALELGVSSVTVPFIPNPTTKDSLTHKATAYKLKHVLTRVLQSWSGPVGLKEVKLYCTPAAVRHIAAGLAINPADCPCSNKRR